MKKFATYKWLLAASIILILVAIFASINLITPISGDFWAPRTFGKENGPSLIEPIAGYIRGFTGGNPRIGQFWLIFGGYFPWLYDLIASIFAVSLVALMGIYVRGRSWKINPILTLAAGIISLGLLWFIDREIGPIFFYEPANSNYLFAAILLMSFILPYFLLWGDPDKASQSKLPLPALLGFVLLAIAAGMAHETYGPPVICLLGFLLIIGRWIKLKVTHWMWGGFLAFFIGYLAIFLAPGQDKRYTESRFDGLIENLSSLDVIIPKLFNLFAGNGLWILLVGVSLLIIRVALKQIPLKRALAFTAFLIIGAGTVTTAIAAPIFGERLGLIAHISIAIFVTGAALSHLDSKRIEPTLVAIATILSTSYLWVEYNSTRSAYSAYRAEFDQQATVIRAAIKEQKEEALVPAYSIPFYAQKKYLFPEFPQEGPSAKVNKIIARYYGLEKITMVPPENIVRYGLGFLNVTRQFTLINCPEDDRDGWDDKNDYMGTLVCGETYDISYDTSTGEWVVSGIREVPATPFRLTRASYKTKGMGPETGQLRIWGGSFRFNQTGAILTHKREHVGQIID